MTKEILWLNSEFTAPEESDFGRTFGRAWAADCCLSSIRSAHVLFRTLLNTVKVFSLTSGVLQVC